MWGSGQNSKGATRYETQPLSLQAAHGLGEKQKHPDHPDTLNTRIGHRCLLNLLGHFWCQIVCSCPHRVRAQFWQLHYMHTSSPHPSGRKKEKKKKHCSLQREVIAMIERIICSTVHLLCHRESSKLFQQDSCLHTLWMSLAFTSGCHYHATKPHLWQRTGQPSHFS